MKLGYGLAVVLMGGVVLTSLSFAKTIVEPQFAVALAQENVNTIAEQITVMIDGPGGDEQGKGSGVIVGREGNIYYVLTNRHVVEKNGDYQVQTVDGTRYVVNYRQIQKLPELDLALVQFSSNQNYRVAKLGDSEKVSLPQKIYVFGYATPSSMVTTRRRVYAEGKISDFLVPPYLGGYSLVYSLDTAEPGMSGGPVLDEQGRLIGINGLAERDARTGRADSILGIPSNTFRNWQVAVASTSDLAPEEISKIANEITVKIFLDSIVGDNFDIGSGVIVKRQGDSYAVITTKYLVQNDYSLKLYIVTPDGHIYRIYKSQQIGDLDLVVLWFASDKNYRVAETGNSDIVERSTIYVAGYILEMREKTNSNFSFFSTLVTGKRQDRDGYLGYNSNNLYTVMSGAPLLDTQGRLIGIHVGTAWGESKLISLAIPTNLFVSLLDKIPFPSIDYQNQ